MKVILLVFVFIHVSIGIPKGIQKKIDKEVNTVFNLKTYTKQAIVVEKEISKDLTVPFEEDNFFKILNDDKQVGSYYFGSALGKTDAFDFVVIFDKDLIIKKIKVLAYREDYGMEIGSKRWLNQFNDFKKGDQVEYQKDIKAISGATISARSMTKAINDLLQSLAILQNKNII